MGGAAAGEIFTPKNFSGRLSGPVLAGDALARSLNVPAPVPSLLRPLSLEPHGPRFRPATAAATSTRSAR